MRNHDAERFASMHRRGDPLLLANAWDVASAVAITSDVFLCGAYSSTSAGVAAALRRAAQYAEAGADSLFVPGLTDLAAIADLAAGPLPIAVMAWPGAATVAELTTAGVVRISLGSAVAQAAYGLAARAAAELFTTGTYDSNADGFSYTVMNKALIRPVARIPARGRRERKGGAWRLRSGNADA